MRPGAPIHQKENSMFAISEQFSGASKANFDAQVSMLAALGNKAVEGVEQLVDLNISVARSSLADSAAKTRQLLSANSPLDVLSLATADAQPTAQKAIVYGRDLAGIVSRTQAEFAKAAESQIAETSRKLLDLVDELSKNAPAGSEHAIAM